MSSKIISLSLTCWRCRHLVASPIAGHAGTVPVFPPGPIWISWPHTVVCQPWPLAHCRGSTGLDVVKDTTKDPAAKKEKKPQKTPGRLLTSVETQGFELRNPVGGLALERRDWKGASWSLFLAFESHFKHWCGTGGWPQPHHPCF